ncbi:MAG TPA: hypothetical protein PLF37_08340 [Planctomycetota bacterium]|nr:hypothetical protein [Planctomycetota bacterium]
MSDHARGGARCPFFHRHILWLLAVTLHCAAAGLGAQDTHYNVHQYGGRSALLGGAVIAGCDDTGAGYYNPGRLGFISNPQLSATADLYQLDFLNIENGAGTGTKIGSTQVRIVPLLASGIFLFEGAPRHAFGFNIISRQYWSASASARREALENVIDDARSPGDEDYRGQLRIRVDLTEYWAGLSYACRFHRYLSFGVTHYACVRLEDTGFQVATRAVGAPFTLHSGENNVNVDYYNVRSLLKAGLAFDIGFFKAGVTVTTPSLSLFGSGTVSGQYTVNDLDTDGNGTGESLAIDDRQEGLSAQFRSSWAFGFGVEYTAPTYTRIALAVDWYLPVGEYAVMRPASKNPIVGIPGVADSRKAFQVLDQRRGALNVAAGIQQKFTDTISGAFSFRTDFTVKKEIDSEGFTLGATGWNLYHLATGLIFNTGRSEFSAGIQFSIGAGQFEQPVNFTNVRESKLLTGDTRKVEQGYFSMALIAGYTYYF